MADVAIVGLGYVGLPLLLAFRDAGSEVIGIDIDGEKIEMLMRGESYLSHISGEKISRCLSSGATLSTDMAAIRNAYAVIIAVPTPLTDDMTPDLSYIESTAREIGKYLAAGQLVSLESTTYPGTTRDVLIPILEKESGLKAGKDFMVAFSPERVDPGDPDHDLVKIPKIVSGVDEDSLRCASELYEKITPAVVPVSTLEAAEMAKLLENIYRSVNIALVNEMKMLADSMGLDIWEVIEAASTKPFGFQAFYPGPGLGGHCLPIDPFYLSWIARTRYSFDSQFINLAGKINSEMPDYVLKKLEKAMEVRGMALDGAEILLVGVAYKPDISDTRESPGMKLMKMLEEAGARVSYHDPFVPLLPETRRYPELTGRNSVELEPDTISRFDLVIIATDHTDIDYSLLDRHSRLIIDTRNAMQNSKGEGADIIKS
jgi:UDP-N-acetyl-D-glucosamine dehydrogenase